MAEIAVEIVDELERLSPVDDALIADWEDVVRRTGSLHGTPHAARTHRRTVLVAAAALAVLLTSRAVAAIELTKTPAQEERSLLEGHSVFAGMKPNCAEVSSGAFRCVLARPPTGDGTVIEGSYLGSKFQTVDADKRIDGGCIGASEDGRIWDCYLGQLAVEKEIVDESMLGVYQPGPGHG